MGHLYCPEDLADETLTTFLERVRAANHLATCAWIFELAELSPARSTAADLLVGGPLEALAQTLGVPTLRLSAKTSHRFAPVICGTPTWGEVDALRHDRHARAHVCPACLADEPTPRLSWRLTVLTACPRHGGLLIPRAGKRVETGEPNAQAARRHVAALLGLDGALDPRGLLPKLPPPAYFAALAALGPLAGPPERGRIAGAKRTNPQVDAEQAAAHHMLATWPDGFLAGLDAFSHARPPVMQSFGALPRQLDALAGLGMPAPRDVFARFVTEHWVGQVQRNTRWLPAPHLAARRFVSRGTAARHLGVHERTLADLCRRGIVQGSTLPNGRAAIERAELALARAEQSAWVDRAEAARRLGVDRATLTGFVTAGLVTPERREVLGRDGTWFQTAEIESLRAQLHARGAVAWPDWIPAAPALARLRGRRVRLADIAARMLRRRVGVGWVGQPGAIGDLRVSPSTLFLVRHLGERRQDTCGYVLAEAARHLGVHPSRLARWVSMGEIETRPDGRIASRTIARILDCYTTVRVAAAMAGVQTNVVRHWVTQHRVRALQATDGGEFLVQRDDVLRRMDRATAPRAAASCGIPLTWVRGWIRDGSLLPVEQHGRHVLYSVSVIRGLAAQGQATQTAAA